MIDHSLTKERDYWFDNAKAILILIVVVAHLAEVLIKCVDFPNGTPLWLNTIYKGTYFYHMPVFMIISGRFSRNRVDRNDWVSVVNKLVVPYLGIQTAMMFFYAFIGYASVKSFSYLKPLFGFWYIFCLAVFQLITPHLKKFKGLFWLSLVLAIAVQYGAAVPYGALIRVFTYYPFFLFGYNYFHGNSLDFCRKRWFRAISLLAFAILIVLVAVFNENVTVGMLTLRRVVWSFQGVEPLIFLLFTLMRYGIGFLFFFFRQYFFFP